MQKENILLAFSVFLSITILSFSIFILVNSKTPNSQQINQTDTTFELSTEEANKEIVQSEETIIEEKYEIKHSAWIPAWDFSNGQKSLEKNKGLISTVSPVLYGVNTDGTLVNRKPAENTLKELITFCNINNIRIVPTVGSYDYNVMRGVLQSQQYTEKHIDLIIQEVKKYDFDGIDIDYEKIRVSEKEGYLRFLSDLNTELKKIDKQLVVTVVAKTRDMGTDTLEVQDWVRIGQIADEVRIMAYDYTLQTSKTPGPIGPITWIDEVLEYGVKTIGKEKVVLGVHLYAYLWKEDKASALTQSSVLNIINNPKIEGIYKSDIAEGYADYTCSDGSRCILYYQTVQGVAQRVKIAQKHGIKGLSYWRLGSEEDLLPPEN